MLLPYQYSESGLDNVYIYNLPVIVDMNGEKTIYIQKINKLHKVIAEGIITKAGIINNKEIRFLRTEMGYTQTQFSEMLGKEAQACGRWERAKTSIDKTTDALIRVLVANTLELSVKVEDLTRLNSQPIIDAPINIDGADYKYTLMRAA